MSFALRCAFAGSLPRTSCRLLRDGVRGWIGRTGFGSLLRPSTAYGVLNSLSTSRTHPPLLGDWCRWSRFNFAPSFCPSPLLAFTHSPQGSRTKLSSAFFSSDGGPIRRTSAVTNGFQFRDLLIDPALLRLEAIDCGIDNVVRQSSCHFEIRAFLNLTTCLHKQTLSLICGVKTSGSHRLRGRCASAGLTCRDDNSPAST